MVSVFDVAKYFLAKIDEDDGPITHLKLQKLLYPDSIEAWAHGPVVPTIWQVYKGHSGAAIPPNPEFDPESLPSDVRGLLDEVYSVYGQFAAWRLREMTHDDTPWKTHAERGDVIPQEELRVFFKARLAG